MKLLVCGGAGFIGSAFVRRRLTSTEDELVVLDKLTYAGNRANLESVESDSANRDRFRFVQGDIADDDLVRSLVVTGDVDGITNFAAESHVDRSILDAKAFLRTGVEGVHVLLEATRALAETRAGDGKPPPRYLQVSTDEVYGSIPEGHVSESAPLAPQSPYSVAKAAGDLLVQAYAHTYGLDTVITRGANTYGPFQHPEKVMPLFITNALREQPLPLYGDGMQRREWVHVDDHAEAIGFALDHGVSGSIYNIPGTLEQSNIDLTKAILREVGAPESLIRRVPDRPGHDRRYAMDGTRLRELGWAPRVSFEDGLRETVAWYRTNVPWWEAIQDAAWGDYYERQYGSRLSASADT